MILRFSGSGNSGYVSQLISDALGDPIHIFAPGQTKNPQNVTLKVDDGRVIWIMPTHAWGLPYSAAKVAANIKFDSPTPLVHHGIITCGDDIGYADREWRKIMAQRGWATGSFFSVTMPNTYTFLPGFDVDAPEVANAKLDAVPERTAEIARAISAGTSTTNVMRGRFPWTKSHIIHPLFIHMLRSTKPFYADDKCEGCGKCAKMCPLAAITMEHGRPTWAGECTMCGRCYHACPKHAVQYGRYTKNKGQYLCRFYYK